MSVTPIPTASRDQNPRGQNPRGQGDRLRIDLLHAAAELIAEQGSVDRVSLRAVAARAGVSPTAVYRHFENATDLLGDAVVHCWESFDAAIESAENPDIDCFSQFRQVGSAYVAFVDQNPGQYRAMHANALSTKSASTNAASNTDTESERVAAMYAKIRAASLEVFAKLVGRVEIMLAENRDDRDPVFVATQVHTWIHGIVDVCTGDDEEIFPSADELLDDLTIRLGLTRRFGEPTQSAVS